MRSRGQNLPFRNKIWQSLLLLGGGLWLHGGLQAQIPTISASGAMTSASIAAASTTKAHIPTQAFASLPFVEHATLSPDGQSMAGMFGVGGVQHIMISEIFGTTPKRITFQVPDMNEIDWIQWVGNDDIIVGLRALHNVEGGRWYVRRMIAINSNSRKVTRLLWDAGGQMASNVIYVPTDGSPHILVSAQDSIYTNYPGFWPSVYRVNIRTGGKTIIQPGRSNLLWWGADDLGRVRTGRAFQDGGVKSSLLYRADGTSIFVLLTAPIWRMTNNSAFRFTLSPGPTAPIF